MAKIKRLKDKNGNMHTLGDADVNAYESTLSGATTNVPYSSAVKAAIDAAAGDADTALTNHKNDQTNPHKVTKSQIGLGNVENKSSATIRGEITSANVTNALGYTPVDSAKAGVANGFATLDSDAKIPASQLPSFVDDVIEGYLYNGKFYQDAAHTIEITAVSGKIYVNLTDSKTYRWSGTQYVVISESLALGETSSTAYRGDRGKAAYDHSQVSGDATIHHTHSNKSALDNITQAKIDAWDAKQPSGNYKTTQTAKTDPTASGTSVTFIATITQNANGEITATKKTVQGASASQAGLMSKDHYSKLEGVSSGANKVEASTNNGKIKIDGTETTVYTHPSFTAATAAAKKVGMDAQGHVVLGAALAKGDVGLGNVENKSSATIRSEITSKNVTDALGFTPMGSTVGLSVGNDDDGYYVELS